MNVKELSQIILDNALRMGFSDAEVRIGGGERFSVNVQKGDVEQLTTTSTRSLSFRGTYNGKIGTSWTEWFDIEAMPILLEEAKQNASIIEEEEQPTIFDGFADEKYVFFPPRGLQFQDVPIQDRIDAALAMEKAALGGDKIKAADWVGVSVGKNETLMMNTYGLELESKGGHAGGYVSARAVDGECTKTGGDHWSGYPDWASFDPEVVGKSAAKKAADQLHAKQVPTGTYKIVLDDSTAGGLFGNFLSIFSADVAQKGRSLLAGRLGEKIANDNFTLTDTPHAEGLESSYDAEGVATYNKAVVENGVFKTFLHNRKTAKIDGVKSTGNANSGSSAGFSNARIKPGTLSEEEIIAKCGDGLYITSLAGFGANATSGDISMTATGFVIEGGKIGRPVEQITVAGNFFDVIKDIEEIGKDVRWGYMSPCVLIKSMSVAGE